MAASEVGVVIPGWSHPGEFEALADHASKCPGPWVEIGSYCGRSTLALVEASDGGLIALHDADATGPLLVRDDAIAAGWVLVEQVRSLAVLTRP